MHPVPFVSYAYGWGGLSGDSAQAFCGAGLQAKAAHQRRVMP
jgi:hypothetical protein